MQPFALDNLISTSDLEQISIESHSRFLAGGTNLIDLMKLQIEAPRHIVNLSDWQGSRKIEETDTEFSVGACVTNSELANFCWTRPELAVLGQALLSGATVQLRNRATTAGNLLQRTRCHYFYDTAARCNKRSPNSGCDAQTKNNRMHAIFGTSEHCIATHPSDMAVAMVALNAQLHTINASGQARSLPVCSLYRCPGATPHLEHHLDADELITHVTIPRVARGTQVYRKVRDRSSYAFALVSAAATLRMENGKIESLSLAFGGVGTRPWSAKTAVDQLRGNRMCEGRVKDALKAEFSAAKTTSDNAFKVPMLTRVVCDLMRQLSERQSLQPGHEGALYV